MRYQEVLDDVREHAVAAGRNPDEITLVAVSKTVSVEEIRSAYEAGCRDFGENRIPDALAKQPDLPSDIRWHMIGSLQRKKVPKLLGHFELVHSVDSPELAVKIAEGSAARGLHTAILLQVNTSGEASKHGLDPEAWEAELPALRALEGIELRGVMTMAPFTEDESVIRSCFRALRDCRDRWQLQELSMGMTNDYHIAIEEGATLLRIGSAIFT